jgi:hypothetical protein
MLVRRVDELVTVLLSHSVLALKFSQYFEEDINKYINPVRESGWLSR